MDNNNSSLFVGDLSIFCEKSNLYSLFSPYGEITDINMVKDRKESNINNNNNNNDNSNNIQFAFVKYVDSVSAKNAMESLNGTILLGRFLRYIFIYKVIHLIMISNYIISPFRNKLLFMFNFFLYFTLFICFILSLMLC